jgi:Tol biopolymer transport system component
VRRVTKATSGCEFDPAISPDGQQLAFMSAPRPGEHAALVIGKPDGTGIRTLVPNAEDNLNPVFVPHSKLILFLRSGAFEHYSPVVNNHRHKFDVFSVDTETGKINSITEQKFYDVTKFRFPPMANNCWFRSPHIQKGNISLSERLFNLPLL